MPAVIFLLIGGLVKICIFNFSLNMNFDYKLNLLCKKIKMSVSNILVNFMVANLIIFAMVYTLVTNENNCQLYLSNFVIFDMVSSFLALFNMWRESH